MSQTQSGYIHSIHNHGHGDIFHGLDSISIIEGVWVIKNKYWKLYIIQFPILILFYLSKKRNYRNIKDYTSEENFAEILDIIKYINDLDNLNLCMDEELLSI